MRRTALLVAALLVAFALHGSLLAEETQILTGEYVWTYQGEPQDLEATFIATGKGQWEVSFDFKHRGTPHTYSGTAEGSLTEGKLEGEILNEGKNRTFTFTGEFADGTFRGTHAEITDGRAGDTGTMTLSR